MKQWYALYAFSYCYTNGNISKEYQIMIFNTKHRTPQTQSYRLWWGAGSQSITKLLYSYKILNNNSLMDTNTVVVCSSLHIARAISTPVIAFTKRKDVLPPNLMKYRSLEFGRHLSSTAAEVPSKFPSDWKSLNPKLAASILHEILR